MKFYPASNNLETGLYDRMVSANGLVQIGFYKVLYGVRVRAGFCADHWGVEIDWCAGDSEVHRTILRRMLLRILESRPEDRNCFAGLPLISRVKPALNDPEFRDYLCQMFAQALAAKEVRENEAEKPEEFKTVGESGAAGCVPGSKPPMRSFRNMQGPGGVPAE